MPGSSLASAAPNLTPRALETPRDVADAGRWFGDMRIMGVGAGDYWRIAMDHPPRGRRD